MALLRDRLVGTRPSRSAGIRAALGLAAATLVGCVLFESLGGSSEPGFDHAVHVEGQGLECTMCHAGVEESDEPGMPPPTMCALCHEEGDESVPPEKRPETFFDGDTYRAQRLARLDEEVIFSHLTHVEAGAPCEACHGDMATSERVTPEVAVSMDDCMTCHEGLGQPNECSTCHSVLGTDVAPWTHDAEWMRLHGPIYRSRSQATVDDCTLCHQESTCTTCHQAMAPESHTNYWRRRAHGLNARMDRDSCTACHQSDSCNRCHEQARPMNHSGPWGSPQNTHCLACHLGDTEQSCSVCHQGAPSHALAPPKPPDHSPGMNCLMCHGVTQPLPHANKGDDCNACHQ
jgi:hypothetical protein